MPTIRARCHTCGIVDLALAAICLNMDAGSYSFSCPVCGLEITRRASRYTLMLLFAAGVSATEADPPATTDPGSPENDLPFEDCSPDPKAPPFSLNDLIDFHFQLEEATELSEHLLQER